MAVFAGMLGVTLFGIFLTPVFFYVIRRFSWVASAQPPPAPTPVHVCVKRCDYPHFPCLRRPGTP